MKKEAEDFLILLCNGEKVRKEKGSEQLKLEEYEPVSTGNSFIENPILELGFVTKQTEPKKRLAFIEQRVTKQLVIPMLEEGREEELFGMLHPTIRICCVEEKEPKKFLQKATIDLSEPVYRIKVFEEETMIFETLAGRMESKKHMFARFIKKDENVVDYETFIALLLIWSEIRGFFDRLRQMPVKEREEYVPYAKAIKACGTGTDISQVKGIYVVKALDAERFSFDIEKYIADLTGISKKIPKKEVKQPGNVMVTRKLLLELALKNIEKAPKLRLNLFLSKLGSSFVSLAEIFFVIAQNYEEEKYEYVMETKKSTDYAKAFECKKNISKSVQRTMNLSLFHKVFSYVEYDNTVNIVKFLELEQDFLHLNSLVFKQGLLNGYSLRFRRLGCLRTTGAFYPFRKCMCVDINNPDGFSRAFFYLLDYHRDKASKKVSFQEVYEKYISLLEETVTREQSLDRLKKNNTRYNLAYYKRSNEVFARCGEIFLYRILGIESSLVSKCDTFAYPDDRELEELITDYFSDFLQLDVQDFRKEKGHVKNCR